MANDHEELVALFRYSVISEAVATHLSPPERGPVVRALRLACLGDAQRARSAALADHARPMDRRL